MIGYTLQQFFAPLILATRNRGAAMTMLTDMGWTLDDTFQLDAFAPLAPVQTQLTNLLTELAEYEAGTKEIGDVIEQAIILGEAIFVAIEDLQDLTDGQVTNLAAPLNTARFWRDLALDLPEYLILTYLETYLPLVHALLDFGGVIGTEPSGGDRPDRKTILWDELGDLFTDPAGQIRDTYNWGGALNYDHLMKRLAGLIRAMKLPARRYDMPGELIEDRGAPGDTFALGVPLLEAAFNKGGLNASGTIDALLAPVPGQGSAGDPTGLLLTLQALGAIEHSLQLGGGWNLGANASIDATGVLGIELQPTGLSLPGQIPDGSLSLSLTASPPTPMILMGKEDKTRVELARFTAGGQVTLNNGTPSFGVNVGVQDMALVVKGGDGDSFLSDVLGDLEFKVPIELGLDWSDQGGLEITGGAGVDIQVQINRKIGPLEIFWIHLAANAGSDGGAVSFATAGSLTIGPFAASIEGIGFSLEFEPQERGARGGKGAVSVTPGFKPPTGLGLSVDAPGVTGGGFLRIMPDEGRYDGILNLGLLGLEITAIGLIATRLPSGEDGWSMFISISVQFGAGIQLGFGFKLTGVGGLAGINRGIDIEALGDGVRTGALDAILFPDDPVANAPVILSTLDTIFPAQQGQYVFGPVFQLGWGTPTVVTVQLGLAIQLPTPLTISLLGSIGILIGTEDLNVIDIKIDIVGTLWPAEGKLAIDSSIRTGKIAFLNLSGDMSVRADFGSSQPSFLVANGGFHPQFEPPDGFPQLARLSLTIFNEPKLRLGVEAYLAVTSNSLQFGVAAFFYAEAIGLSAEGRFEFDTLIYFKPFGLTATLGFQVSIKAGSKQLLQICLRGTLQGPKPWLVTGYAEFRILGIKNKFRVEMTVGRAVQQGPRDVFALFDEVLAALQDQDAWADAPADDAVMAAVLLDLPEDQTLVHPAGRLKVTQSIAPLSLKLEKFGEATVSKDENLLELTSTQLNGRTVAPEAENDWFSPAQYFEMKEDEKLSAPSFEKMQAGVVLGDDSTDATDADEAPMGYETKIVDPDVWEAYGNFFERQKEAREPEEERAQAGPKSGISPDLNIDLVKTPKAAGQFAVKPLQYAVRDTATPGATGRTIGTFSEALSAARDAGPDMVVQAVHELEMEDS